MAFIILVTLLHSQHFRVLHDKGAVRGCMVFTQQSSSYSSSKYFCDDLQSDRESYEREWPYLPNGKWEVRAVVGYPIEGHKGFRWVDSNTLTITKHD